MARRFSQLGILISLIACADTVSEPRVTDLQAARQLWAREGSGWYSYTVTAACFCVWNGPVRATVENDSVVHAVVIATGDTVNTPWVPTINSLFDFIQDAIDGKASIIQPTYDPDRGFPTRIVYDGSAIAIDDEITYTISNVELTPTP